MRPRIKIFLTTLFLSLLFAQAEAFAQNLGLPGQAWGMQAQNPQPKKSFFSDFDLMIINRFWFAPQNQNNYLSNEAFLTYNFNDNYSVTVVAEYDQQTSYENAEASDFQDTDIRFNYVYAPKSKTTNSWDIGGGPIISIPTSHSSQDQKEYLGLGAKVYSDINIGSFTIALSTKFYEYFYENPYYVASSPSSNEGKSEPDTQVPDIPPTFNALPLSPAATQYTVNANSYSDNSIVGLFKLTSKLILRNEFRYESLGYFDNHNASIFHDKYGVGYKFAPEFALWVSEDAAKNPDLSGSVFDSKFTTTIVSFYFNI